MIKLTAEKKKKKKKLYLHNPPGSASNPAQVERQGPAYSYTMAAEHRVLLQTKENQMLTSILKWEISGSMGGLF